MEIRSALNSMGLQQIDKLLTTPIKIDFPVAALTQPEISWSAYSGSINLEDLPKLVTEIFKRDYSENEEQPVEKKCIRLLGQIELCREVIKKVESLKTKILTRWKEKTFGKLGSYLNGTWSTFSDNLKDLSQELDKQEKKVKYIYQESIRETEFLRDFFDILHNFQKKPKTKTYYYFSFDNDNFFENIFNGGNGQSKYMSVNSPELIDPYEVMNLPQNATSAEIKKRYHQLALELHPDKNGDDPKSKEKFQEINNAYEILRKRFQIS